MPLHTVVVAADIDLLPGKRRQEVVVVRQPLVDVRVWRCFIEADDKSVIWRIDQPSRRRTHERRRVVFILADPDGAADARFRRYSVKERRLLRSPRIPKESVASSPATGQSWRCLLIA